MKKFYFILSNSILFISLFLFAYRRFTMIEIYYKHFEIEFTLALKYNVLKYDVFLLSLSLISILGIIFGLKNKVYFFISMFYAATQFILLCYTPSISFSYFIMIIGELLFLKFLIFDNIYIPYSDNYRLKLLFLLIGLVFSIPLIYFWGNN